MRKVKLSNCGDFILTPKLSTNELSPNNYITTDNMLPNKAGIEKISNIPSNLNVTQFVKNDILLSNIRPYFKKIWLAKFSGGCSADVLIFRTNNNYDSSYIKYCLSQDSFFIYNMAGAKGSKMPRGDKQHILNFELLDFDLMTQKKIGNLLKAIDEKIDLNNKINSELEKIAKELYNYWFVQFDFPDEKERPYKSSGGKMVYNQELKREIPYEWEVKTLNDCVTTIIDKRGVTPKKLGGDWVRNGIIALSAKIVKNNRLIHLDEANQVSKEMFEKWMKEKLQDGDILMTSEAPLGEFYYLVGNTNYCLSQRLFAIRANPAIVTHSYLFNELSEGHGFSQIIGKQSGSTVFGIRQDELRKVLVIVPNIEIQKRFTQIVLPNYRLLRKLETENLELVSLRDYLLPLLMNGQVSFKN